MKDRLWKREKIFGIRWLNKKGKNTKIGTILLVCILVFLSTFPISYSAKIDPLKDELSTTEVYNLIFFIIEYHPPSDRDSIVKIENDHPETKTASNLLPFFSHIFDFEICIFTLLPECFISWEVRKAGCTLQRGNLMLDHTTLKFIRLAPEQ